MPPKAVDKAKQKEREKIAVDKTFGLKNKNKSKVVQKYIKSIANNASGAPKGGKEQADRDAKDAKQKEIQKAALMNSLFNMSTDKKGRAFDPVAKKKAKAAEEEAIAAGRKLQEELKKEIIEGVANTIRLTNPKTGIRMSEMGGHPIIQALKNKHQETFKTIQLLLFIKAHDKVFWVDDAESSNPLVRCLEDVEAEVAPDERPLEEIIEERRAALPPGGTPVTPETFKAWKEKREAERLAQVEADRQENAKKGTKGLVGMSGRDLFTYDASLFKDEEGAVSADEYDEREEDPEYDDDDGKTPGVAQDLQDECEDGEDEEAEPDSGARGSEDVKEAGAINEKLFLEEEDLPDDLDDLDEADEEAVEEGKG
ncbi:unnamed protein product [Symbiodinium sp. CCMP2456]|nr:unnamed protein product [Symbiodinium sp. CCMP2456]